MNELNQLAVTDEMMLDEREQIIDQLMHEYSDDILHLVYTYVKNRATAEDLTQEIFIKCYEKLYQFNQQATIKTWLYRIAINHCKDYLRSWHYRKITLSNKILDYIPSKSKRVEDEVITNSEKNSLTNAVMNLPLMYREVVFLHYYEELTFKRNKQDYYSKYKYIKNEIKACERIIKRQDY